MMVSDGFFRCTLEQTPLANSIRRAQDGAATTLVKLSAHTAKPQRVRQLLGIGNLRYFIQ